VGPREQAKVKRAVVKANTKINSHTNKRVKIRITLITSKVGTKVIKKEETIKIGKEVKVVMLTP